MMPTLTRTSDNCFIAEIDGVKTGKYSSRVGALKVLCEMLVSRTARMQGLVDRLAWRPTGPCECGGWGAPTGCPGCGIRSMGG